MQNNNRRYNLDLLAILNMLGIASLLGFLYCLTVLLHGSFVFDQTSIVLYLLWFAVAYLSVSAMKHGDKWGAYALAVATVAITIYDLVNGFATIGGAMLGFTVMCIVMGYIQSGNIQQNQKETRLTN